jgi:hypothetical protein
VAGKTSKTSAKVAKKDAAKRGAANPTLLSGGNPQIAKAEGDAPVQAYIAAMPGWKSDYSLVNGACENEDANARKQRP